MGDIGNPSIVSSIAAFQYASQAGFNNQNVPGTSYTQKQIIVAIATAESGLDAHSWNKSDPNGGSFGILQINGFWFHPMSGPAISQSQALDPQNAFNYAYNTISARGTNFAPWSTFTSGAYKKYVQQNDPTSIAVNNLPTNGWWNFNITHGYGSFPDAQGYYFQPDNNIFGVPAGYPIAAILPGTVTGTHGSDVSYGGVVTVKLDNPINNLATHYAMLHMTRVTVSKGTHINAGEILGYAGGNITAGSAPASLGFALYPGDDYATDGSFQQYFGSQNKSAPSQLDSYQVAKQAANGTLGINTLGISTPVNSFTDFALNLTSSNVAKGIIQRAIIPFNPDQNIAQTLADIDKVMKIDNPLPDVSIFANDHDPLSAIGTWFTVWIPDLFQNLGSDLAAIILRATVTFLGIYIVFRVVNSFIDFSGVTKVAETASLFATGA